MLKNFRRDPIVGYLSSRSSLTDVQLDTLLISGTDANDLEARTRLRDEGKVTKGSYLRTLSQAKGNIESSLYTLFLLSYLGLAPPGGLSRLATIAVMMSKVKESLPTKENIERLLEAISEFAEEFSRRSAKE